MRFSESRLTLRKLLGESEAVTAAATTTGTTTAAAATLPPPPRPLCSRALALRSSSQVITMLRPRRIDSMRSSLGSSEDDEAPLPTEMPDLQRASTLDAVVEAWRKVAERSGNVTPGSRPPALSPGARLRAEGVPCDIFLEVPPRRRAQSCSDLSVHVSPFTRLCPRLVFTGGVRDVRHAARPAGLRRLRRQGARLHNTACAQRLFTPAVHTSVRHRST